MKKILVTAVGGDIGYGIVKALKAGRQDLHVIGCDIREYNMSYDLVDEFFVCPPYREGDRWTSYMLDMLAANHVDYFWPVTEPEIKMVDQKRNVFLSVHLIMNQPNVLGVALDKGETARFLAENGVRTPKTWKNILEDAWKYPVVVKERFGCGSHSVAFANNREELERIYHEMESPIIQEYIGDKEEEYTLTVFSDGNVVNKIAFKRELGFGGMSRYVELSHDERLSEIADRIAKIFQLHGSINVQLRVENGEYYVFEINPRISSTVGFRTLLGFCDATWWIDMIEKNPIQPYTAPEGDVFGVRTVEEKIYRNKKL